MSSGSERIRTDICVIGAGSGGLSVAAGAAQMGARVVLVEGGRMGGDCLNYGCVPSKTLIASAARAHAMRSAGDYGISGIEPEVDYAAVKDRVHRVIADIAPHDSQERFEAMGVRVIRHYGRFVSPTELQAGACLISARRFVIATGSSPLIPRIEGLEEVPFETNETLFDLRERPGHLIVVGGGPIGMEMAQAHRRLGCEVTVIEAGRALSAEDPEMTSLVLEQMRSEGVNLIEGAQAERVTGKPGQIAVETDRGTHRGTHLLIAVGRKPNLDRLDLDRAGVRHGKALEVGDDLRTSNRRIYAVGDVAGRMQFTHVAGHHGSTVLRALLFGLPARARQDHLPRVTYTDPELAHVGLTEEQARARHGKVEVIRLPLAGNDRARATGETAGAIKLVAVRGRAVGVSIAAPHAGELIGLWSLVIAKGIKLSAVAGMVAPYPTLGEISKRAAGAYFSPRLFDSPVVKRVVRRVQKFLP